MDEYKIHTTNINNSLVFYRALFDRMPDLMDHSGIEFQEPTFRLAIKEGIPSSDSSRPFHWPVQGDKELKLIHQRMHRFMGAEKLKEICDTLEDSLGLVDPDGYKWIIGVFDENLSFEKCYVEL